ncbi:ABC transporter C family member 8 [Spatholobus suberectus]|nr:ABC transporter C family member 8 [Spatholobus suberectus]
MFGKHNRYNIVHTYFDSIPLVVVGVCLVFSFLLFFKTTSSSDAICYKWDSAPTLNMSSLSFQTLNVKIMNSHCFSFTGFTDNFSWICLGDFSLTSFSTQRCIIDIVNIFFVSVLYVSLLINLIKKNPASGSSYRKGRVHVVASVCCTLLSIAYFIDSLWNLIAKTTGFSQLNLLVCIVRGLVWISLAVSLSVQGSQWIKILCSIWWLSSCTLVSALNVEILLKKHTFQFFDMAIWPLHILTVLCAFQNHGHFVTQETPDAILCEPLLVHKVMHKQTGLGQASFLSRFTFSWMNALLNLGYSKPLALEDIPSLVSEDKADFAYQKFAHAWDSLLRERGRNNSTNLVLWSIARVYLKENFFIAICTFLRAICAVVSPLLVYSFVNYSSRIEEELKQGMAIVGCLIFAKVVESVSQRHWFFNSRSLGMKTRSALMAAVYQKQLKLSTLGRRRHSTGEIVNYIAADAYRMGEFPWWFHTLLFSALQLFLAVGVLFGVVGLGALPGLVPLLICGFLNVPFAKILQKWRSEFMIAQDERLRSTSEILSSMKIIKLQSWEDNFKNAPLNAGTIFTVLAALRSMEEPVTLIPEALSVLTQVKVSFDRLNTFLLDDEIRRDDIRRTSKQDSCSKSVEILTGNFSWDQQSVPPTLRDVNFEIKWGQTVAVCGPVGAGKTSLLYAILGEIPKISGTVSVSGTLVYVSQTPWIQSGTIRDNILYGKPMDETRYKYTIKVCALDKDIDGFSHGGLTEIGQRGINMSGGQKHRIQLARAVYNDADIYLLDDSFSAVDAHTASILFNDCIKTALRRKTVILVTHQVEFLTTSKAFFSAFTDAIFNAPMFFFDSTPVGRILTRASSDLSILDFDIPFTTIFVSSEVTELLTMIGILVSVTWQVLIVAVLAMVASKYIQGYYQASAREIIRINGTTKAPLMNFTAETSLGVVTIRAFNMADRFFKNYLNLVDTDATMFFHSNAAIEWLILRIEVLQNLTLFTAALLLVLLPKGYVTPALEKCQLKATISSLPNLLDTSVSDEGENWSVGQRQLICLGRVLLKRNRILVLDEATASIDFATDVILQRVIRQEFSECTVITVAHRVPTVIDSDTVMVLSYGKLVDYDKPSKLVDTNSSFSKLVAEYWSNYNRNLLPKD